MVERQTQNKEKPIAFIPRKCLSALFHALHKCDSASTGLKCFQYQLHPFSATKQPVSAYIILLEIPQVSGDT